MYIYLEGAVLIKEDEMVAIRNTAAIPVYILWNPDLPDQNFYAVKRYVHASQEVTEDTFFVAAFSGTTSGGASPGPAVKQEHVSGIRANDGLNLFLDHMKKNSWKTLYNFFVKG